MRVIVIVLLALVLAACGAPASNPPPAASPAPASPSAAVSPSPAVLPSAAPPAATPTRAQLARSALAAHLKIPAESLQLESEREEQWRDGALGCPAPGQNYTQAIVPGYLLVFSDGMAAHSVHTTASGFPLVYCSELGPVILNQQN